MLVDLLWEEHDMKLMKSLLLAASLAIPVTAIQIATFDNSAHAHAKKKKKVKKYKSCGTFKYNKGGKCLDARDKK